MYTQSLDSHLVSSRPIERTIARICSHLFAFSLLLTGTALPWGGAHSLVNRYAVDNLPPEMVDDGSGNAFGDMKGYLSDHAFDPDFQKDTDLLEKERHWCNIDSKINEYPWPFTSVPRDYAAYCSIFGRDNGVIQWEGIRDHYENLVALMGARDWPEAYQRAAELGHYMADSTCPLHATANFDGELSFDKRNIGIHGRYEGTMVDMYIGSINTTPDSATTIQDPVELSFDILAGGQELVSAIMAADLAAQNLTGSNESEEYYQDLFNLVGADAQTRLDLAAKRLADLWYSAWIEAGSPSFSPVTPTPSPTVPPSPTPTVTPSPSVTVTPTATPTGTPTPLPDLDITVSSNMAHNGDRFSAEATVHREFRVLLDAYCVIICPGGKIVSVVETNRLQKGVIPISRSIPWINAGFRTRLLDATVTGVAPGEYTIVAAFVPSGMRADFTTAICYDMEKVLVGR